MLASPNLAFSAVASLRGFIETRTIHVVGTIVGSASCVASGSGGVGSSTFSGVITTPLADANWSWHLSKTIPGSTTTTRSLSITAFGVTGSFSDTLSGLETSLSGSYDVSCVCDIYMVGGVVTVVPQASQTVTATLTIGTKTVQAIGSTGSSPSAISHFSTYSLNVDGSGGVTVNRGVTASGSASGSVTLTGWPFTSFAGDICTSSTGDASTSASTNPGYVDASASGAKTSSPTMPFDVGILATGIASSYRSEEGEFGLTVKPLSLNQKGTGSSFQSNEDEGTHTDSCQAGEGEGIGGGPITLVPVATATAKGALTGTPALAFAASPTASALGNMVCAASMAFAANPSVVTPGLTASPQIAFHSSVVLTGLDNALESGSIVLGSPSTGLTGLGKLSVSGQVITFGSTSTPSAAGDMAASGAAVFGSANTGSAAGDMGAAQTLQLLPVAIITAGESGVVAQVLTFGSVATLTGTLAASTAPQLVFGAVASLGAAVNLSAPAQLTLGSLSALSGVGLMSASPGIAFGAVVSVASTNDAHAAPQISLLALANLTGIGNANASQVLVLADTPPLVDGAGGLVASAAITFASVDALSALGIMAATPHLAFGSSAILDSSVGMFSANAIAFGSVATLTGVGDMVGDPVIQLLASPLLGAAVNLGANGAIALLGFPAPTGIGNLLASPQLVFSAVIPVSGVDNIASSNALAFGSVATLTGSTALTTSPIITFGGSVNMTGIPTSLASGDMAFGSTCILTGVGDALVSPETDVLASASLKGVGDMAGSGITTLLTFIVSAPVVTPDIETDNNVINVLAVASLTDQASSLASGAMVFGGSATLTGVSSMVATASIAHGVEGTMGEFNGAANPPAGSPSGTPVWRTGRTGRITLSSSFNIPVEWLPIGADYFGGGLFDNLAQITVHYKQRGDFLLICDDHYKTTTIDAGTGGPSVSITPYFKIVEQESFLGDSPYRPDSPTIYKWYPEMDPGGAWTDIVDIPGDGYFLYHVDWGWRISVNMGISSPLAVRDVLLKKGRVVFYEGSAIPLGGVVYDDNFGNLPAEAYPVPNGIFSWPQPDRYERTGGDSYSDTISGVVTMSADVEEFFSQSSEHRDISYNSIVQRSELFESGLPKSRTYMERPQLGGQHQISVVVDGQTVVLVAETISKASSSMVGGLYTTFARATMLTHSLGSGGAEVSGTVNHSPSWSRLGSPGYGGTSEAPLGASISNVGGSADASHATAISKVLNTDLYSATSESPNAPYIPGGHSHYKGGLKVGSAISYVRVCPHEEVLVGTTAHTMADGVDDVPLDIIIHNNAGNTPLFSTTGLSAFEHTFTRESRATLVYSDFRRSLSMPVQNNFGPDDYYHSNLPDPTAPWSVDLFAPYVGEVGVISSYGGGDPAAISRFNLRGADWPLWTVKLPAETDMLNPWAGVIGSFDTSVSYVARRGGLKALLQLDSHNDSAQHYARLPYATMMNPQTRYVKVRMRSIGSSNQSVRFRLVGTPWDITKSTVGDGEWAEVLMDYFDYYTGGPIQINPVGINQNDSSTFWQLDIPKNVTIQVEWMKAIRRTFARVDAIDGNLTGIADGAAFGLFTDTTDLMSIPGNWGGWTFSWAAPSNAKPWGHAAPVNENVGAGTFPSSYWYDADNNAYLWGRGLRYPDLTGVNQGVDNTAGLTLRAQDVLEAVIVYPSAGDVLSYPPAAYGKVTHLRFSHLAGAEATGLELGTGDDSGSFPSIEARKISDGVLRASGSPDTDEHYAVLSPELKQSSTSVLATPNYRLTLNPDGGVHLDVIASDRKIIRTLWHVTSQGRDICYYMDLMQRHFFYYATASELRLIRVYQTSTVGVALGDSPSVGTKKDTLVATGQFGSVSSVELSGVYPASGIGDARHGGGTHHMVMVIEKVGSTARYYLTSDSAESWKMETIPGTYTALTATEHRARIVAALWRSGTWYVRVGAPRSFTGLSGSGDYAWSSESVIVATSQKSARLWVREDGTVQFSYLDDSSSPRILACSNLGNDGTGTWN